VVGVVSVGVVSVVVVGVVPAVVVGVVSVVVVGVVSVVVVVGYSHLSFLEFPSLPAVGTIPGGQRSAGGGLTISMHFPSTSSYPGGIAVCEPSRLGHTSTGGEFTQLPSAW